MLISIAEKRLDASLTKTRDDVLLGDARTTLTGTPNEVVTVEFRNQPKGNLLVVKQDSVTKKPLEGVEFKITYADGSYVDACLLYTSRCV